MTRAQRKGAKPTGRPPFKLTAKQWKTIGQMAADMCTAQEIADYLGINRRTLYEPNLRDRFEEVMKRKHAATRWKVKKRQLQQVMKSGTNPVPGIWWGKQHLGQTDRQDRTPETNPLQAMADVGIRLVELLDKAERANAKRSGA